MIDNINLFYLTMVGVFLIAGILLLFWNRSREKTEPMYNSRRATAEKSPLQAGPPELQKQSRIDASVGDQIQEKIWYYSIDGIGKQGPVTEEELRHLLNSRRLLPDTLVWTQELPYWSEASLCKTLRK
jgi:hypothetical protein